MNDLKAAIRSVRVYRDQFRLAEELERALVLMDEAPSKIANYRRLIEALKREIADLEDTKDKTLATVEQMKADAEREIVAARVKYEHELAEMAAILERENANIVEVRAQRKSQMAADEVRYQAKIAELRGEIKKAKYDGSVVPDDSADERPKRRGRPRAAAIEAVAE